jgi:hypothetical protein
MVISGPWEFPAVQIPRRGPRRRTLLFILAFAMISVLVIATFAAGQAKVLNPRNDSRDKRNKTLGEIEGKNPANDCWKHHAGEGMRDTVVVYPIVPRQLKVGEPYDIPVQILNPWKQEVRKIELDVKLIGDQVLTVEAAASSVAAKLDRFYNFPPQIVGPAAGTPPTGLPVEPVASKEVEIPFEVPLGASALVASVELAPRRVPPGDPQLYDVLLLEEKAKFGTRFEPNNATAGDSLNRHYAGPVFTNGTYRIKVEHTQGNALETDVFVNVTVVMGKSSGGAAAGEKIYTIKTDPAATIIKGGAPLTYFVTVVPFAPGPQNMEFHVRAENYYKHQLEETPNEDFYNRYANLSQDEDFIQGASITPQRRVMVGSSFVASEFGAAGAEAVEEQWQLVLAEMTGFAAAGLLLPSLLLGGTYGKASRRLFNNILGGAKRRVMFHNLSSLALSLVAVIHIVLFVLEIRYTILMGVMWGGFGALSLLILGLTGYYQVPLIQRHGYKWWRFTHLAFGLLVVIFVGYHMIADGPDFFFLKERIPQWINEVNLAQK